MSKSKNEVEWEKIFEKHRILDKICLDGYSVITATEINEFREARLMTKFDHRSQLPKLFADHKLSILPTSRGGYIIGTFETFCDFQPEHVDLSPIEFPSFLESLDYREITSEATAINCAFVSKILHRFTNEDNLYPTVSGRMSSSSFGFEINSSTGLFTVNVGNSQVEIDGGYEGDHSLNLIEAKNYISDDFLIRQLYYPFRLWSSKIRKKVRPIFLTFSNGVFHFREYDFSVENHYNSIVLVKQVKYVLTDGSFNKEALLKILTTTETIKEPEIPFPQANSFERIINLCELLNQKEFITKEEITQNYDFDERQTDYYSNGGKYLGLVETGRDALTVQACCFLTTKGKQLFNLNLIQRKKEFVKLIISHSAFRRSLELYLEKGEMPAKDEIVEIMKQSKLYNVVSESTFVRRSSTIIGWINWIIDQLEE